MTGADLEETVEEWITLAVNGIRTYQIGTIISYDPDTNMASVQLLNEEFRFDEEGNPKSEATKPLTSLPVFFWGNPRFYTICDVKPGDPCEVHFSKESLDDIKWDGQQVPGTELRKFSLKDATCRVGAHFFKAPRTFIPKNGIAMVAADQSLGPFKVELDGDNHSAELSAPNVVKVKCLRFELQTVDFRINGVPQSVGSGKA